MSKSFLYLALFLTVCVTIFFIVGVCAYSDALDTIKETAWAYVAKGDEKVVYFGLHSFALNAGNGFKVYEYPNSFTVDVSASTFALLIICLAFLLALLVSTTIRIARDSEDIKLSCVSLSVSLFFTSMCAWVSWYIRLYQYYVEDFDFITSDKSSGLFNGFIFVVTGFSLLGVITVLHAITPVDDENVSVEIVSNK